MKPKTFKTVLIIFLVFIILSTGAAVASQYFGAKYNLVLGPVGRIYNQELASGRYIVGQDLPAGKYSIKITQGQGILTAPQSGVSSDMPADTDLNSDFETVLENHDSLILNGIVATVECKSTEDGITPLEKDPTLDRGFTLKANKPSNKDKEEPEDTSIYLAGRDFPAGVYTITAVDGSGVFLTDFGIDVKMDSEIDDGNGTKPTVSQDGKVKRFYNLHILEGQTVQLQEIELYFMPH